MDYTNLFPDDCRLDEAFYGRIRGAAAHYELSDSFTILPPGGHAFTVKKGHILKFVQEDGPQAAVVAFWNAHNPREYYNCVRNRLYEGLYIGPLTRLWSDVPYLRPMLTCIEDTVEVRPPTRGFHYHRFWTHCTPETMEMRTGRPAPSTCHVNLLRAVEPFGLKEEDLRYNVKLFEKVRLNPDDGKLYAAPSDAKAGDYIAFYAEIDLLVAVSICPHGDNARDWGAADEDGLLPVGNRALRDGRRAQGVPQMDGLAATLERTMDTGFGPKGTMNRTGPRGLRDGHQRQ